MLTASGLQASPVSADVSQEIHRSLEAVIRILLSHVDSLDHGRSRGLQICILRILIRLPRLLVVCLGHVLRYRTPSILSVLNDLLASHHTGIQTDIVATSEHIVEAKYDCAHDREE